MFHVLSPAQQSTTCNIGENVSKIFEEGRQTQVLLYACHNEGLLPLSCCFSFFGITNDMIVVVVAVMMMMTRKSFIITTPTSESIPL